MLAAAYVEHHLPGRSRLRIPSRRGDKPFFSALHDQLAKCPGVQVLKANPATGSVLIAHRGEIAEVKAFASRTHLFELDPAEVAAAPTRLNGSGERRRSAVSPEPLPVAAAVFSGLSLYQVARSQFFGSAAESLWSSYQLRAFHGRPGWAAAFLAIAALQASRGKVLGSASSLLFYALTAHFISRMRKGRTPSN
jgi:hypothetical protein